MDKTRTLLIFALIFFIITPILITMGVGIWLTFKSDDSCLNIDGGEASIGAFYLMIGLGLIFVLSCGACCGFCCNGNDSRKGAGRRGKADLQSQAVIGAAGCSAIGLVVLMFVFGIMGLVQGTSGFGKIRKDINGTNGNWKDIKSCIFNQQKICYHFQHKYANDSALQFFSRHFTNTQSGCCKPPEECSFNFSSPTVWIKPNNNGTYSNQDCYKWDNNPKILCYNCQACKLGFIQDLKKPWTISGALVLVSSLMMILGCFIMVIIPKE